MKPRAVSVALLLLGAAIAQDSDPIPLSERDRQVPICRGNDGDAPGCVTPPHATHHPDPTYPNKARKYRQQGTVLLWLIVGSDGLPRDVKVERGLSPDLNDAALDAVKRWKFDPATKDHKPVAVQINVEVSFKLY